MYEKVYEKRRYPENSIAKQKVVWYYDRLEVILLKGESERIMKKRKKILTVLLPAALTALFLFGGCGEQKPDGTGGQTSAPSAGAQGTQTAAPSAGGEGTQTAAPSGNEADKSSAGSEGQTGSREPVTLLANPSAIVRTASMTAGRSMSMTAMGTR